MVGPCWPRRTQNFNCILSHHYIKKLRQGFLRKLMIEVKLCIDRVPCPISLKTGKKSFVMTNNSIIGFCKGNSSRDPKTIIGDQRIAKSRHVGLEVCKSSPSTLFRFSVLNRAGDKAWRKEEFQCLLSDSLQSSVSSDTKDDATDQKQKDDGDRCPGEDVWLLKRRHCGSFQDLGPFTAVGPLFNNDLASLMSFS